MTTGKWLIVGGVAVLLLAQKRKPAAASPAPGAINQANSDLAAAIAAGVGGWFSGNRASTAVDQSGDLVFFPIAPGQTETGTVNSTGGFTAAPDPNGIGGGFAT